MQNILLTGKNRQQMTPLYSVSVGLVQFLSPIEYDNELIF
jgi:hypothetical protein